MKALAEADPLLEGMYWIPDAGLCSGVYALEKGRTLIDAGNMYGLIDELRDIDGYSGIERILVTHGHFDHTGGVAEIYRECAPDFHIHPLAREHLRLHEEPFPSFFEELEKGGKIVLIRDGEIPCGNLLLRVIPAPGHTAADLCFFDPRSGALFSGDAVLPNGLSNGPALSASDETLGGCLDDKIQSLRKLLALPVRHLMPGHGEPVFHKGADQIKIALYNLHRMAHGEEPAKAWSAMSRDLLDVGKVEEARQCAAKASMLGGESRYQRG